MKIFRFILAAWIIMMFVSFHAGSDALAEEPHESALNDIIDDYEVVIRDSVNWYLALNYVEESGNIVRYAGKLYYTYSGREIVGNAKAVYDAISDTLTAQCVDNYDTTNPDYMAYGLVFNSVSSYRLRGGWAYVKAKWQGTTSASLLKGEIKGHLPKP